MITVRSRFAVPIATAQLGSSERLNAQLEQLFLEREDDAHRNPAPSHIPQQELYESRFNLFGWTEPCVQELRQFVLAGVARTVLQATSVQPGKFAGLQMHNHTWFHITRYAGSFIAHNHPMASWSAVYCVRAGDLLPNHPDSGLLRFFDPRGGANGYRDPANAPLGADFAFGPLEMRLAEGQLVVFPSYVFHEVTPFYGRNLRITVASNCWFS